MTAECPLCKTRLEIIKYRWFTNMFGLTKPYFECPSCKWKKKVEDVHKDGGLGTPKRNYNKSHKSRNNNYKPRHHRSNGNKSKRRR